MTDNEIIKALECCAGDDGCDVCPMYKPSSECITELQGKALDLINRFAKELQTAKAELKETTEKFNCQQYVYTDLSDIIKEKNAEIERLKKTTFGCDMSIASIKAEAIKELLDKIEKQAIPNEDDVYWVELDDIYNLVKEMVGDME